MVESNSKDRRRLSGEQAYRRIFEAIQNGELKPGARVREEVIARELGISRTPVREALRRLEIQGLLVHEPHRGMVIRELDHNSVTELYLMREVLEGTAAALAARHASDAEIATLREMVEADRALVDEPAGMARNNRLFHQALYRGAHNRYLLDMLSTLRSSMSLLGETTLGRRQRAEQALSEHDAIVTAIEQHDPTAAEKAARDHIQAAHRARLKLMFEHESLDLPL